MSALLVLPSIVGADVRGRVATRRGLGRSAPLVQHVNAIGDGNAGGFELFDRGRDSPIGQVMVWVVVEADDEHPRMMTTGSHDQVMEVFEVLRATSSRRGTVEKAPGAEPGRLVVPLLLDQRPISGHVIEGLQDCLQRNLIAPRKFFGSAGIRTVDDLVDSRRADPPTLKE